MPQCLNSPELCAPFTTHPAEMDFSCWMILILCLGTSLQVQVQGASIASAPDEESNDARAAGTQVNVFGKITFFFVLSPLVMPSC